MAAAEDWSRDEYSRYIPAQDAYAPGMKYRFTLLTSALFWCAALAQEPAAAPAVQKYDFQALPPGALPEEGYTLTDQEAKFQIVATGEEKCLELSPLPLVDGGMLVGKSITGPCTVTARIEAVAKKRSHPRFGVALHGMNGPRLRMVPARGQLELVYSGDTEETAAAVDLADWVSGKWCWMELSISAAEGGSLVEGRLWMEGAARPDKPQIRYQSAKPPGQGKASVWGAPYSGLAIRFDDISVK